MDTLSTKIKTIYYLEMIKMKLRMCNLYSAKSF